MADEVRRPPDDGTPERDPRDDQHARAHHKHGSFLRELPIILVAALVLSLLIKSFLVQAFYIPSGSMQQTLAIGDRVFVNKLAMRVGEIERGDIVVFRDPADWLENPPEEVAGTGRVRDAIRSGLEFTGLAPSSKGDDLIKRVIGVGGDTVACCTSDGRVTVNGEPLDEESYLFPGNDPSTTTFSVKVPQGSLWVMGDHREESLDSRAHIGQPGGGFLPVDHVIGRAFVVVWPFEHFGGLTRPDTYTQPGLGGD